MGPHARSLHGAQGCLGCPPGVCAPIATAATCSDTHKRQHGQLARIAEPEHLLGAATDFFCGPQLLTFMLLGPRRRFGWKADPVEAAAEGVAHRDSAHAPPKKPEELAYLHRHIAL